MLGLKLTLSVTTLAAQMSRQVTVGAKSYTKSSTASDPSPLISRTSIDFTRRLQMPADASDHNYSRPAINSTPRRLSGRTRPISSAMRRCTGGTRSLPPQRLSQGPARGERHSARGKRRSARRKRRSPRPTQRAQPRPRRRAGRARRNLQGKAEPAPFPRHRDFSYRRPPRRPRRPTGIRRTAQSGQGRRRHHRTRRSVHCFS